MEELKPYIVKFEDDGIINAKTYLFDCKIRELNQCPIVVITYDECNFSVNDGI